MRFRTYIIIILFLIVTIGHAGPSRGGIHTFYQPDGTTFIGKFKGDEFTKIITTTTGNAIIKGSDGWWYYATYEADGTMTNSGWRVGADVPTNILAASNDIPYDKLAANAAAKRRGTRRSEERSLLARIKATHAPLTKGVDEVITKHGLVILAEYADVKFEHSREDFVNLLTQKGYSAGGATGCAKEYFDRQFDGMFNFDFQVSDIVTLTGIRAYYGGNGYDGYDKKPAQMIHEACLLAHDAGTDFSLYDDDGDGYVDNVFVFFAGGDEADDPDKNADCIWSHSWFLTSGAGLEELTLDGKIIDQYACSSEIMAGNTLAGIGTFCHEFSHTLNLPDFYDTDYESSGGWSAGLWSSTSIMDGGNSNNGFNTPPYYNAIEREIIGLSEPILIEANGTYTLEPIHRNGQYYRLDTDKKNEYYLLECRSNEGWDQYIGGHGMLIYHIDRSKESIWENNSVNVIPTHQNADLIEADNRDNTIIDDLHYWESTNNIAGIFYPHGNNDILSADSTPSLKFWSGVKSNISIMNISRTEDGITFSITGFGGENPPVPVNLKTTAFMDAAIINFESDRVYDAEATLIWKTSGGKESTVMVSPYEAGKYSYTIEGLEPGNKTYSVTVFFEEDGIQGEKRTASFMTSRHSPVEWPYLYLGKYEKNDDGSLNPGTKIALRAYNSNLAEQIEWTFNDEEITAGGDGFFTVTESGILRAYVYWEDGGVDILEKTIKVKGDE